MVHVKQIPAANDPKDYTGELINQLLYEMINVKQIKLSTVRTVAHNGITQWIFQCLR